MNTDIRGEYQKTTMRVGLVDQVEDALRAGDFDSALKVLGAFHAQQLDLINSYFEWIDGWRKRATHRLGPTAGVELRGGHRRWNRRVRTYTSRRSAAQILACLLRPPQRTNTFQVRGLTRKFANTERSIKRRYRDQAIHEFNVCVTAVREVHDALVDYVAILGEQVFTLSGVEAGAEDSLEALSSCSYYEPAWDALLSCSPDATAAAIVEEFQAHLSGPGRRGLVTVEEDDETYRIVLDACGSGGAMRRRLEAAGLQPIAIPNATPITWSIAASVPPYCSHCAQNELTAFSRAGRLVWTTAFSRDPHQPCGWIVFKNRDAIPAHYYRRLGLPHPTGES